MPPAPKPAPRKAPSDVPIPVWSEKLRGYVCPVGWEVHTDFRMSTVQCWVEGTIDKRYREQFKPVGGTGQPDKKPQPRAQRFGCRSPGHEGGGVYDA